MIPEPQTIALEPKDLRVLGTAFDEAWSSLAPAFNQAGAASVAGARTKLAHILFELMKLRQLSSEQLKRTAVRIFKEEGLQHLANGAQADR